MLSQVTKQSKHNFNGTAPITNMQSNEGKVDEEKKKRAEDFHKRNDDLLKKRE